MTKLCSLLVAFCQFKYYNNNNNNNNNNNAVTISSKID